MGAPHPGTLLSALLIVIAHPPLELHPAIWVGLVPWLVTIRTCRSWGEAAVQGFWLNFLLGLGGAFWVSIAVPRYLELPIGMGFAATVVHAAVHQLQLVAFAPVFHRLAAGRGSIGPVALLVAALVYTGLDWLIPNLFRDTFGFVLHNYRHVSQVAELGGAPLLTFLVLIANLGIFSAFQPSTQVKPARDRRARAVNLGLGALLLAGAWGFGWLRIGQIEDSITAPAKRVQVGLVQGNVPGEIKHRWARGDSDAAREALSSYVRASRILLGRDRPPELIVWPETAYPGIFRRPENERQAAINVAFDAFLADASTPFVFGGYDREERLDARVLRNALFFVEPKPEQPATELSPMQVYHKHILFPIGEYLPLVDSGSRRSWLPGAGTFSTGAGPKTVEVETSRGTRVRIGPSICYEDLFASHAAALARQGAELIVNVSNDSWFGNYGLPQFHLIAAKLRSIEVRLPQLRVTNTGYSALILSTGEVIRKSRYGAAEAWNLEIALPQPRKTLMTRWGDWFGAASLVFGSIGLLLTVRPTEARWR